MRRLSALPRTDMRAMFDAPFHWFCDTCGAAVPDSEVAIPRDSRYEPYHRNGGCFGECVDGLNCTDGVFQALKGHRKGRVIVPHGSQDSRDLNLETQRTR